MQRPQRDNKGKRAKEKKKHVDRLQETAKGIMTKCKAFNFSVHQSLWRLLKGVDIKYNVQTSNPDE